MSDPSLEYQYDCLYILRTSLTPDEVEAAIDQFRAVVIDNGGDIVQITPMGQKRLAYEIHDEKEGIYVDMVFSGKSSVNELRRRLRIDTRVLRHIIVKETDRQYKARIKAAREGGAPAPSEGPLAAAEEETTEGEPLPEETAEAETPPEENDADDAFGHENEADEADQATDDDVEDDEE